MRPEFAHRAISTLFAVLAACGPASVATDDVGSEDTVDQECPELVFDAETLLVLESEEEVLALPPYTRFDGWLSLRDVPGITDLSALRCLREVRGILRISSPDLQSLDGLERLETVVGGTNGFPGLLEIRNSPKLTSVNGLSSLRHADELEISENALLTSLDGLSGLESAEGIRIWGNDSLTTIGLRNLVTVESLSVGTQWCVRQDPDVYPSIGNAGLTGIDGLDSLETLEHLLLSGNPNLISLDGLVHLADAVGDQGINLAFNESLPYDHILAIQEQMGLDFDEVCNNLGDPTECTCW